MVLSRVKGNENHALHVLGLYTSSVYLKELTIVEILIFIFKVCGEKP